ncbi:MAG: hypothetical protein K2N12_04945 [Helicobacter sp.]|nr:hypothetical protein [Helicobacter sp.]
MNPIHTSGYQNAKANAAMLGAKVVEHTETENMAATTITNDSKKKEFASVGEYAKYLGEQYGINQAAKSIGGVPTTINVPSHVLQQAFNDPEAREWLEENLKILQQPKKPMFGEFVSLSYNVDSVGSITTMAVGTNDPDGSIARANAKRKQEEAREKERLEQERIEAKKEEEKRLEELREKGDNGQIQVTISGESAKAVQAGLANALQSGIALDVKM